MPGASTIDWLRESRANVEAKNKKYAHMGKHAWTLEVSNCCQALMLTWTNGDDCDQTCTACGKTCCLVTFDALAEPLSAPARQITRALLDELAPAVEAARNGDGESTDQGIVYSVLRALGYAAPEAAA